MVALAVAVAIAIAVAISVAIADSAITVAIAVKIAHPHRCCHWPLPPAITIAMPLAISESCCLGAVRIVFDQLKQRMLTFFYFVWTVGSALIKAG